ncbi:MAG: inositol-3-phosphate synthase [Patescibacteria group bacterium]
MKQRKINVAIVGLGNCAGSLIEGLTYYQQGKTTEGLLFPILGEYSLNDIEIVVAFDISDRKVGKTIDEAIYESPNNFYRIANLKVLNKAPVLRGPTLDGNPEHLQKFVKESKEKVVDVPNVLKKYKVDILINLLPTGSIEATEFYGLSALKAKCAFVNCIPTIFAQKSDIAQQFEKQKLPLIGDDIKSQVGSTMLHRSVLNMLKDRGAKIIKSSQINIGGNTDFANFIYRAQTKLISKYKSLSLFISEGVPNHIGHHYDPTKGAFKKALFDMEAEVFAGSKVKISIQLESDDKPNSAGSIIDLIRIAKAEKDKKHGGVIKGACAYYMKSAPYPMEDGEAYNLVSKIWA